MRIVIIILIGLTGGIIGGMGMGGGTLLIPLLTIFADMSQHAAQAVNLIAFIPMSITALIIHIKNKLVVFKYLLWIAPPAMAMSVLFAFLAKKVSSSSLSVYFGIFLIVLGIWQITGVIITMVKTKKKKKKTEPLL